MISIVGEESIQYSPDVDRMIKIKECKHLTSYSQAGLYRAEKEGRFPTRKKIGPRAVAWRLSEVKAWVAGEWYPGWKEKE
jgi:prophage regulatory protein